MSLGFKSRMNKTNRHRMRSHFQRILIKTDMKRITTTSLSDPSSVPDELNPSKDCKEQDVADHSGKLSIAEIWHRQFSSCFKPEKRSQSHCIRFYS